jgi:2-oxoglutarate ferredoxin oxidoreductase subunit alpha
MLENIGLAVMTEAPCVVVDVMRGGPSTGQPTSGSQGDVMQCRWGIHGDAEIIALAPKSVQEMYDLTVEAFNLSEAYRVPVFILSDANIGHTYETLVIPPEEDLEIVDRKRPRDPPGKYLPFKADEDLVPPMASFGEGHRFYATGLTHDERGYPDASPDAQDRLVRRLCDKIRRNRGKIIRYEEDGAEDCDVLVFAYGTTARSATSAVQMARREGLDAGLFRPVTLWPFPDERLMELSASVRRVVVAEMNYGQLVREVERAVRPVEVSFLPTLGENPPRPEEILGMIRRVAE